jgi:hypothetical protein
MKIKQVNEKVLYVYINDYTYYIDDSTNEQYVCVWKTDSENKKLTKNNKTNKNDTTKKKLNTK